MNKKYINLASLASRTKKSIDIELNLVDIARLLNEFSKKHLIRGALIKFTAGRYPVIWEKNLTSDPCC